MILPTAIPSELFTEVSCLPKTKTQSKQKHRNDSLDSNSNTFNIEITFAKWPRYSDARNKRLSTAKRKASNKFDEKPTSEYTVFVSMRWEIRLK